jgi:DNA recombination protein RmuC
VLVTARQFEDIGVTRSALDPVRPVAHSPRALTAVELLEAVGDQRPELPEPEQPPTGESRRPSA